MIDRRDRAGGHWNDAYGRQAARSLGEVRRRLQDPQAFGKGDNKAVSKWLSGSRLNITSAMMQGQDPTDPRVQSKLATMQTKFGEAAQRLFRLLNQE